MGMYEIFKYINLHNYIKIDGIDYNLYKIKI